MRRSLGFALFVSALVVCAGSAGAQTPRSLFPIADGNRWVFRSSTSPGVRTMSLERRAAGFVLDGFPGAGPLRVRAAGGTVEAWDRADRRWEALLRFGAPTGSVYRVSLGQHPLWRGVVVTVASKQATARGSDGRTYRSCVRFTLRPPSKLVDAGVLELTFAPGVGPVRWTEQTIAGPRGWTLASYRPGTSA